MVSSDGWLWIFRAGVGFLLLAALLFLLGFATDHWHDTDPVHYGLWNSCDGAHCSTHDSNELPAYHIATQGFQIMAVLCFALSPIVHFIFYCQKKRKDTGWRSRILDVGYSAGILFHMCSILIFGLETSMPENVSWSYKMSCASSAIAFFGVIMIIVSRKKALYKFTFRSVTKSKRKPAVAAASMAGNGRFSSPASSIAASSTRRFPANSYSRQEDRDDASNGPNTNVNITININTQPSFQNGDSTLCTRPSSSSEHSNNLNQKSSSSSSSSQPPPSSAVYYSNAQSGIPDHSTPVPAASQHSPEEGSDSAHAPYQSDHSLTQVRPAPKSSISDYSSPSRRPHSGTSDKHRDFEKIDNNNIHTNNETSDGANPIPTISVSAPPYEEDGPPSYSDVMATSGPQDINKQT